jgi:RHS repeat-associated protein
MGNVRAVLAMSGTGAGTAVNYTAYDGYGTPTLAGDAGGLTALTGTYSTTTRFGFGGGYVDDTGLVYLVHRYYDAVTGQFLSVDPLENMTQAGYSYAGDDPLGATDPSGMLFACSVGDCGGAPVRASANAFTYPSDTGLGTKLSAGAAYASNIDTYYAPPAPTQARQSSHSSWFSWGNVLKVGGVVLFVVVQAVPVLDVAVDAGAAVEIGDGVATVAGDAAEDGTAATGPGNGIGPGTASVNDPSFINGVPSDSDLGQAISRGANTTTDADAVFQHLENYNDVSPEQASAELHDIKSEMEGNPDVVFTWSGGVYDSTSGDYLGTLIP